ncbi:MAG: HlyD family efflux transporter periplasmic adaptor subunit, partial [Pyrinomonadaceae bacterium]
GQLLVKLDPNQLQSNTDAQVAALQASQNEVQVSRSQILAAQNQMSQAQQSLSASQAAVDTAQVAVSSARQQVISAQTDVDKAQVEVTAANRELKRSENLLESGVVSRLEVDNAKDRVANAQVALQNAKSRLQSQQIAVKEAQSQVNEAKARVNQQAVAVKDAQRGVETANLSAKSSSDRANQQAALLRGQQNQRDKTLQVAPINGVIAEIPSKVGTFAVAGLSTTALMTIADMSTVNVEVKVDETEIDKVEVGQSVKVKVDALGDRELKGEVTQKTPLALGKSQTTGGLSTNINTQESKEFRVVIQLQDLSDDVHDSLRPGMSATAVITTKTAQDVIAVPLQAIIEKQPEAAPAIQTSIPAPAEKPKPIKGVFVLNGNKVKFIEVTTGISGESDIQITSGLNEGDEVVTGPSRVLKTLKDGDVVKRQTAQSAANSNKS